MGKLKIFKNCDIFFLLIGVLTLAAVTIEATQCKESGFVYGENELVDQLMVCSMSKSFDLDLTPQGEYVKNTLRVLVDQGLSNKTSVIYAKLSGLWSAKRAEFIESGWRCGINKTVVTSVVELSGLSLEVVEKVDIPLHRNQHKIAHHKPCKTFDLPLWMCRQSKPIFRTTKTWVNRAYFNLTLTQEEGQRKPVITKLDLMFTCPETFKQKITYSPSAVYILSKFLHNPDQVHESPVKVSILKNKREVNSASVPPNDSPSSGSPITHPASYAVTQDGKKPATPPYYTSVNLIVSQTQEKLRAALEDCIQLLDSDLSLVLDYNSFDQYKYKSMPIDERDDVGVENAGFRSECSNKHWLRNRVDWSLQSHVLEESADQDHHKADDSSHSKRSQFMLNYPVDPSQLLNPYAYYYANAEGVTMKAEDN